MVAHVVASLFGLCVFARMHIYTGVFMYACVLCVFCVELWVLACLQVWLCMSCECVRVQLVSCSCVCLCVACSVACVVVVVCVVVYVFMCVCLPV